MNAGDQPPDVDDLARSMMELLGVHEHDEPHADDDIASEEKTASPTILRIAWCGASAVRSGRPNSRVRHERGGS